jgi:death-on-curing protein
MKKPYWLEKADILAVHDELLAWFGGLEGVRDPGLLDSAMHKPKLKFQYEEPSLFEMAAAYAAGIVGNHPFSDGNKRTGFVAAALFLEINGLSLTVPEEEAVLMTRGMAAGEIEEAAYAKWLEAGAIRKEKN